MKKIIFSLLLVFCLIGINAENKKVEEVSLSYGQCQSVGNVNVEVIYGNNNTAYVKVINYNSHSANVHYTMYGNKSGATRSVIIDSGILYVKGNGGSNRGSSIKIEAYESVYVKADRIESCN